MVNLGLASSGYTPLGHVIAKRVGDPFTLTWAIRNTINESRWARLTVYEQRSPAPVAIGGTGWTEIPPMSEVLLNGSGPTSTMWTQMQAVVAVLRLEGARTFSDAANKKISTVAEHTFYITVTP
jgi:hypothetical protein